ncbi:p1/s1 nuclease, putative [Plasmodium sp. DRC-Itaito]|uniref:P1/s1 nuclease, putative n=1 Tax=Plasmodium gaboni TaxID=647221 RepID=A0ABY1UTR6_9APIC|nr:p1/s1 nuclease, putative [Plasmodium gaboni]SOV24861.1 p1/s1 nuclease, putative [Plasmodium sp. DRC-Itaito]
MIIWFLLCISVFVNIIASWSDEPHMLISYIAYINLNDDEKEILNRIFQNGNDSHFDNPITASVWADNIKPHNPKRTSYSFNFRRNELLDIFNEWHYVQLNYNPMKINIASYHLRAHKGKHNAMGILKHIYRILNEVRQKLGHGTYYSYNFYLRFFIHIFADLHQPLHAINFFNSNYPNGDKGGTNISVNYKGSINKLHYLCDNIFKTRKKQWPNINMTNIERDAKYLMSSYPPEYFGNKLILPHDKIKYIEDIANESYDIAVQNIYSFFPLADLKRNEQYSVNQYFVINTKKILNSQMVLAGYRLSAYLKDIIANIPPDL